MDIIKRFVQANKSFSSKLDGKFPSYFLGNRNNHTDLLGEIKEYIRKKKPRHILEVGGVDRPLLRKNINYKYVGIDIDNNIKCLNIYDEYLVKSIEEPIGREFDLIISFTLLEHIKNNRKSLNNIYNSLVEGAATYHYVPSKNHPYSIVLRIVGPKLQRLLIKHLRSYAADVTGYPTYFNLCTPSQMKNEMEEIGFKEVKVIPYYKAGDYFSFFVPAYMMVTIYENIIEKMHLSELSSGFLISGIK